MDFVTQILALARANSPLIDRRMAVLLLAHQRRASPTARQVRHIADSLKISKPAVTRAFDGLERLGLGRRETLAEDRRSALIALTKKGEKLAAELAGE